MKILIEKNRRHGTNSIWLDEYIWPGQNPDSYKLLVFYGNGWTNQSLRGNDNLFWYYISAILSKQKRSEADDLALLSLCDHNIMTVGTFGFWAAFLAGGENIYFAHPFGRGTGLYDGFSHEDFFLPHWLPKEWLAMTSYSVMGRLRVRGWPC